MSQKITTLCAPAGQTVVLMARAQKEDQTYPTIATTSSIRVDVYDISDGTEADERVTVDDDGEEVTDGSAFDEPAAADVLTDTLTTDDDRWKKSEYGDSVGFNVTYLYATPGDSWGSLYEVRMTLTYDADTTSICAWRVRSE